MSVAKISIAVCALLGCVMISYAAIPKEADQKKAMEIVKALSGSGEDFIKMAGETENEAERWVLLRRAVRGYLASGKYDEATDTLLNAKDAFDVRYGDVALWVPQNQAKKLPRFTELMRCEKRLAKLKTEKPKTEKARQAHGRELAECNLVMGEKEKARKLFTYIGVAKEGADLEYANYLWNYKSVDGAEFPFAAALKSACREVAAEIYRAEIDAGNAGALALELAKQRVAEFEQGDNISPATVIGKKVVSKYTMPTKKSIFARDGLVHRWSFNGNSLLDEVGKSKAVVKGETHFTRNMLVLAGGNNNNTSMADLGRAIPDNGSDFTIELWATPNGIHNWSRIFDVNHHILWCWTRGCDYTKDRADAGGSYHEAQFTFRIGIPYHLMYSVRRIGENNWRFTRYARNADGQYQDFLNSCFDGSKLNWANYTNFYLGHTDPIWAHDQDASASFDEVRIWNKALTDEDFERNHKLGPDRLP